MMTRPAQPVASTIIALAALVGCGGANGPDPAGAGEVAAADIVLLGGDVLTMDPTRPRATAVATRGDRIVFVGDDPGARALIGPRTTVFALADATVTPGLVDGHAHLEGLGASLEGVDLRGAGSPEEVARRVATVAAARPPGEWILGRGWDQNLWDEPGFPTHRTLDAQIPDHPVALRRVDGHAVWVNTLALEGAGLAPQTPDPPGGRIVRDDQGRPTGVMIDAAEALIDAAVPAPSDEVRARRILRGAEEAIRAGLTGVHEMGIGPETVRVYRALASAGQLPLRVYAFHDGSRTRLADLPERAPAPGERDAWFVLRGVKVYADGALGSRGARLLEDYADQPGHRGFWVTEPDALARDARHAVAKGWQLAVHAIGDAANRAALDAYEGALPEVPDGAHRLRIEHAQVVHPSDLPRFGALGVLAAMQPTHCTSDMAWAGERLGDFRLAGAYAWRRILEAGGRLVGGSDFPVEGVSPLWGIYAAVSRRDRQGTPPGGWRPQERLTLDEALAAFTVAPAFAAFRESDRGRVQVGMQADLTVIDGPLTPDAGLLARETIATIVGGRVVWSDARASGGALRRMRSP